MCLLDVGDLRQRKLLTRRRRHEHLTERLRIAAVLACVTDAHRETLPSLQRESQIALADGCLNHFLNGRHAKPVTCRAFAIDADIQILRTGERLWIDIRRTGHCAQDVGDRSCGLF
jgi:hypothetical protein